MAYFEAEGLREGTTRNSNKNAASYRDIDRFAFGLGASQHRCT